MRQSMRHAPQGRVRRRLAASDAPPGHQGRQAVLAFRPTISIPGYRRVSCGSDRKYESANETRQRRLKHRGRKIRCSTGRGDTGRRLRKTCRQGGKRDFRKALVVSVAEDRCVQFQRAGANEIGNFRNKFLWLLKEFLVKTNINRFGAKELPVMGDHLVIKKIFQGDSTRCKNRIEAPPPKPPCM